MFQVKANLDGRKLVADNGNVGDYFYYFSCFNMLTYQIYDDVGRYLRGLFQHGEVYTTIDHDIIVKNVITEENKLSEAIKVKLNILLSYIENTYDFKEKNILMWEVRDNDLIIKNRVRLRDAYINIRILRMRGNDNYKKTSYTVRSKEDNICKEFGSMAEAEEFIKKQKDSLIN